jgi:hypothetical protein
MMGTITRFFKSASFGALVIILRAEHAYSLEESDKIVVAVFEHEIRRQFPPQGSPKAENFWMMKGLF